MHPRAQIRADLRSAIAALPRFASFSEVRVLARNLEPDQCPLYFVATPMEPVSAVSGEEVNRETQVLVGVRRTGGDDLEDTLDDDSAVLEPVVLAVLRGVNDNDYAIERVETEVLADGSPRIGRLDMVFRVTRYTSEGEAE